ncbi:MAG: type IV pilus twitching motility protein PilT [Verrucomicrobiales bacterium]
MDDINEQSQLGHRIMHLSQDAGVSDFYITPWEQMCYKRNGKLNFDSFVYQPAEALKVEPGTKDYALTLGGRRFRVNRMVTRGRYRWVMRLLPESIPSCDQIKVPPSAIKAFLEAKNGLFLVCGATGSGKSTTIASLVMSRAERRREHVVTFEDPIEYIYATDLPSLISQREMGSDDLDFSHALRAALRQAPDVIVIGEIRDGVTAEIALQAAETGHVVVATLHTSSAAETVQRFIKLIPAERVENAILSFADSMRMILCQQLMLDENKDKRFPVHEMLLKYDSVAAIIRAGEFKKLDHELEAGWTRGMMDFDRSLQLRESEGWQYTGRRETGYTEHEVNEFLEEESIATSLQE